MPTIVICGAGPGLSHSVARRWGREGYGVVLVARSEKSLKTLTDSLEKEGIAASALTADLSIPEDMPSLATAIRKVAGDPEVLYYAPTSAEMSFVPAAELTVDRLQSTLRLLLESFVALINEFSPHMTTSGQGAILTAQGATALTGSPQMSGPGPAMAAQRNYLQSLGAELEERGVAVARVYISSIIKNSAIYHRAVESGQRIPDLLAVDPDEIADKLWRMQQRGGSREAIVPAWGRMFGTLMSSKSVRRMISRREAK